MKNNKNKFKKKILSQKNNQRSNRKRLRRRRRVMIWLMIGIRRIWRILLARLKIRK